MSDYLNKILLAQFEAALWMLNDCIKKCPAEHWEGKIARYPFWQVAYHTLCFTDLYLTPSEDSYELRAIHPRGWSEFNDEHPSRRFEKPELTDYVKTCRQKAIDTLAAETQATLEGRCGFRRLHRRSDVIPFTRGELHLYNLRHIQHHTGQLSAYLRRVDDSFQDPQALRWARSGWL